MEATNRERLKQAIDNMEKTDVCLEIFDRTFDQAREARITELEDQMNAKRYFTNEAL